MAMAQVTIVPLGTGKTSLSSYVADVVKWLEENEVKYTLTPMGTVLEGDKSEILDIVNRMSDIPFSAGAERVMTLINLDDRRDKTSTPGEKIKAVRDKLK